jgi:fumarylacetoacetate (FAA) hydrolase
MKLATVKDGTRDGSLIVVRRDLSSYADARHIQPTLQDALDNWADAEPKLRDLQDALEHGKAKALPLDVTKLMAPLPRVYEWVDGSAYLNHVRLVRKARNAEPPPTLETDPLVYQGGGSFLLGPTDDIALADEAWGCDFESEVVVVLGDVPQGTKAADAAKHVRLIGIANDVSLRNLIPKELEKGFGFFQSKPATGFSPVLVTPDELGSAWKDGRVHLRLRTRLNEKLVGDTDAGPEMHFSFFDLIQHIARTRAFVTGSIVGSGTVSNVDRARGISCLAEIRMIETIERGKPETPFLKYGDVVEIEMNGLDGKSLFGRIRQKVVKP